jgi:hypothetical protein
MVYFANTARLIAVGTLGGAAVLGFGAATAVGDTGKLMAMLPQGFSSSNCQEASPIPPAAEKVTCDQSSEADGPTAAVFVLYSNVDDMAGDFKTVKLRLASTCPGNEQSPGPWGHGSSAKNGGQVECGTIQPDSGTTAPVVVWSDNAKLRLAVIQGTDINSLYQWWKAKSG